MKKLWIIGIIAAFTGSMAITASAHCGTCGKGDKAAKGECSKGSGCSALLKGITLTDDQQKKVDEIEKACDGSKEACGKAKESLRAVLTAEQQKTFDENAAKCGAKSKCCGGGKEA